MLRKLHPLQSLWVGCKYGTIAAAVLFAVLVIVFGFANTDLPGWGWFVGFGIFCIWCAVSLKQSIEMEHAQRHRFISEDEDESA